jgi:hypothetical protein
MRPLAWPPLAAALLLAGCSHDLAIPAASTLTVSPPVAQLAPRGSVAFVVSGGRGPYRVEPSSMEPAGYPVPVVSGSTVTFHADGRGGLQVSFVVSDAGGGRVRVSVTLGDALAISPTSAVVVASDRFTFTATGGQTPYTFSVAAPGSGVVDPSGAYSAGPLGGQDHVVVTDANGSTATALVSISPPLALYPATVTLAPGSVFYFQAVGGRQPYAWAPVDGTVGAIDGAGRLTVSASAPATPAGSPGIDVAVTDGLTTAHARVVVTAPLAAPPVPRLVHPGQQLDLFASGGQPPYRFAYARHGNLSAGALSTGGHYVAGPNAMLADRLEVTDGLGTVVAFDVSVGPTALGPGDYTSLFRPPTGGWQTFAARAGHLFLPGAHLFLGADGVPGAEALSGGALRDVADFNGDGLPDLLIDSTPTTDSVVNMYAGTPSGRLTYFGGGVPVATGSGGSVVMPGPTYPTSLKPGPVYTLVAGAPCPASAIFFQPLYYSQFGLSLCGAAVSPRAASYLVGFGAERNDSAAASIGTDSSSLWVDFFHYTMSGNTTPSLPAAPSLTWTLAPAGGVSILGAYGGPGPFAVDLRGTGRATDVAFLIGTLGTDKLVAALGTGAGGVLPASLQLDLVHAASPNVFAGPYRNGHGSVLVDDGLGGLAGHVMTEPTPGTYAWSPTPFTLPNVGRVLGTGDLDGDGDFDLVELDPERNIVFAPGDAASSFDGLLDFAAHRGTRFRAGPSPGAFQPLAGKLYGTRDDLVVTQPGNLRVIAGTASATGQPALALELDDPSEVSPTPVALVDLDGDGALELLGIDDVMALVSRTWDGQRFGAPVPVGGVVAPSRATPPVPADLGGSSPGLDLLVPNLASARIDLVAFDPGPVAATALDLTGLYRILDVTFVDLDGDGVLDAALVLQAGKGVELRWARGSGAGAAFRFAASPALLAALPDASARLLADPARSRVLAVRTAGLPAVTIATSAGATTVSIPTAGLPYCAATGGQLTSIGGVPHLLTVLQNRGDAACGAGHAPWELQLAAVPLLAGSTLGAPAFTRIGGDGVAASLLTPDLDGDGVPELVYWLSPLGPANALAPVLHVWRRVPGTATFAP